MSGLSTSGAQRSAWRCDYATGMLLRGDGATRSAVQRLFNQQTSASALALEPRLIGYIEGTRAEVKAASPGKAVLNEAQPCRLDPLPSVSIAVELLDCRRDILGIVGDEDFLAISKADSFCCNRRRHRGQPIGKGSG